MKANVAYVFVDDGDPEASDYATNFVAYSPAIPGSLEQATARAGMGPWRPVLAKDRDSAIRPTCSSRTAARPRRRTPTAQGWSGWLRSLALNWG